MGCGASTMKTDTVAQDEPLMQSKVESDAPTEEQKQKSDDSNATKNTEASPAPAAAAPAAAPAAEASASGAAAGSASGAAKSEEPQPNPMVAAARSFKEDIKKNISDKHVKITFDRVFTLPFDARSVWSIISDWNLEYLSSYSSKIKVSTSVEPNYPELLCRDVRLPNGEFHEVLTYVNNEHMEFEYILVSGPLPYKNHIAHFTIEDGFVENAEELPVPQGEEFSELKAGTTNSSVMRWCSSAYVVPDVDVKHAESLLRNGLATSLQVLGHTLTTRLSTKKSSAVDSSSPDPEQIVASE